MLVMLAMLALLYALGMLARVLKQWSVKLGGVAHLNVGYIGYVGSNICAGHVGTSFKNIEVQIRGSSSFECWLC